MTTYIRLAGATFLAGIGAIAFFAVAGAQGGDPDTVNCMANLKQLGKGLAFYSMDFDEKLPPMQKAADFQTAIEPYIKNSYLYRCPATQKDYLPNAAVSGKFKSAFKSQATTMTLRDAKAHKDGLYGVVYLDGHVGRTKTLPGAKPAPPKTGTKKK